MGLQQCGRSMIVGNQVTDLMREVEVDTNVLGMVYFEPRHVQYLLVHQREFDGMEIRVLTLVGCLAKLGTGATNVTLHFSRRDRRARKKETTRSSDFETGVSMEVLHRP